MTTSTQTHNAVTAQNPQQAYDTLYQEVYAPAFFEKLATDFRIRPSNADDAQEMLQMAAKLRIAHDTQTTQKQASQRSQLGRMHQQLNSQLTQMGLMEAPEVSAVKTAATRGSQNPTYAHAALSYLIAQNQQ